jgi:hypothetical protein
MTPEQKSLVMALVIVPGREPRITSEEFLYRFGADDGKLLGLQLLRDALGRCDRDDVELALIVCFTFGFTEDHLPTLLGLASAEWHVCHEDVITALGSLNSPAAVNALYQATQWIPSYLDYDETRALAVKAIRALGRIPGVEAERALRRLVDSDDSIISERAKRELARRSPR